MKKAVQIAAAITGTVLVGGSVASYIYDKKKENSEKVSALLADDGKDECEDTLMHPEQLEDENQSL